jgi:Undecaprenyl-phosphate glucose phosphotransferase
MTIAADNPICASVAERGQISLVVLAGATGFIEGALTAATGLGAFFVYLGAHAASDLPRYALVAVLASQLQVLGFHWAGLYQLPVFRHAFRIFGRMLLIWSVLFLTLTAAAFLTHSGGNYSRVWMIAWFSSGFGALVMFRTLLSRVVRHWMARGRLERRVVIVGADARGELLIEALGAAGDPAVKICGVFDDRLGRVPGRVGGYPVLGSVASVVEFARRARVDLLILSLPMAAENRILQVIKQLHVLPVDIRLSAHASALRFAPSAYSYVGQVPTFEVVNRPMADWGHVLKEIEDRVLAGLFLLLSLPVFAAAAMAIKWDSRGPVFFKQKRYGFNNELIEVYKFRTLRTDMTDATAEKLVTANDPRVTRVGRFLRRTSLDELPQLITVLKGGMSIVGPRPHATQAKANNRLYQEVVDGYYARHRVKPGITGWAQINGWRGETDTEDKIVKRTEHDLYYIDNWSIWFDLWIVAKTPWALLRGTNAY